jgi:hypothetical protein
MAWMPDPTALQLKAYYHYLKAGSYVAAAEEMKVSVATIKSRLYRLRLSHPEFFGKNATVVKKGEKIKFFRYDAERDDLGVITHGKKL